MTDLTILGGGPAGLGLAFYAHRAGRSFTLYERSNALGGMCRTLTHGGHRYDTGAHRFHDRDKEVTGDLRALMGAQLVPVRAPSAVWTRGRFVNFPPTPLNAMSSHGVRGAFRILFELLQARLRPRAAVSFEDFACNRFGPTLARGLLLNYCEKLWGLPAARLSPDIATRRLHGMTVRSLLVELFLPSRKTAHIDGEFLYPRRGYGEIAERLAAALPPQALRLEREIVGFELKGGSITALRFSTGPDAEVRGRVVSTLPVTVLARLLGDALPAAARAAAGRLRFRRIRLVFLRLSQATVTENASIYLPEPRWCVSRLYEPRNRSAEMAPAGETALVAEVPCFEGDELDRMTDADLGDRVVHELADIGLIHAESVLERRHHLLPFAYPVYALGYEEEMAVIAEGLAAISNLDTVGRAGGFVYSHLHDQLRFGKDYIAKLGRTVA